MDTSLIETLRLSARRALKLASFSPPTSPNPRVGCVIWDGDSSVFSSGSHLGAGSPHAEVAALEDARARGFDTRGASALVTLEPCAKQGRTPPCVNALIGAEIARVVYLADDPTSFGGGARELREAGVDVFGPRELREKFPALSPELELAQRLITPWASAAQRGTPYVVVKLATSLDGRIAAADGTSRWITSSAAREHAHQVRALVDGIGVGTGTVLADDPSLTAREAGGELAEVQPRRIVFGKRSVPDSARLRGAGGELITLQTRDLHGGLRELFERGLRHIVVEGGSTLVAEFFRAGLVDEIHHYLAPVLLGAGKTGIEDFGIESVSQAPRWHRHAILDLQPDLLQVLTPNSEKLPSAVPGTWHVATEQEA